MPLSEHDIKTAFLPFLREFYRNRYEYRPETEDISLDNVTATGLIADGLIRFRTADGTPFVCTYEATSRDKSEEVKYTLNFNYFIWDCLAFAALCAAVVYGWTYAFKQPVLQAMSTSGKFGMPLGVGLISFFGWYFIMRRWKKYRYVYAVEQFKQYEANEQWVALGEDVFPAPTDPYLLELKDQCIYNGIGLAIVHNDRTVRPIAAPSSLGVFGAGRSMAHWITHTAMYEALATNMHAAKSYQSPLHSPVAKLWNTLWRPVNHYITGPLKKALGRVISPTGNAYNQFVTAHTVQKGVFGLSIMVIALLTYRAMQWRTEDVAERVPQIYVPEAKVKRVPNPEAQDGFVLNEDDEPIPFGNNERTGQYNGISRQEPIKADPVDDTPTINLSSEEDDDTPTITVSSTPADRTKPATNTPNSAKAPSTDPCVRIANAGGWIIQDNRFSTRAFATDRVKALRKQGITCEAFQAACLGEKGWIVRLGYNVSTEAAARSKATEYDRTLTRLGLKTGKLLIRKAKS